MRPHRLGELVERDRAVIAHRVREGDDVLGKRVVVDVEDGDGRRALAVLIRDEHVGEVYRRLRRRRGIVVEAEQIGKRGALRKRAAAYLRDGRRQIDRGERGLAGKGVRAYCRHGVHVAVIVRRLGRQNVERTVAACGGDGRLTGYAVLRAVFVRMEFKRIKFVDGHKFHRIDYRPLRGHAACRGAELYDRGVHSRHGCVESRCRAAAYGHDCSVVKIVRLRRAVVVDRVEGDLRIVIRSRDAERQHRCGGLAQARDARRFDDEVERLGIRRAVIVVCDSESLSVRDVVFADGTLISGDGDARGRKRHAAGQSRNPGLSADGELLVVKAHRTGSVELLLCVVEHESAGGIELVHVVHFERRFVDGGVDDVGIGQLISAVAHGHRTVHFLLSRRGELSGGKARFQLFDGERIVLVDGDAVARHRYAVRHDDRLRLGFVVRHDGRAPCGDEVLRAEAAVVGRHVMAREHVGVDGDGGCRGVRGVEHFALRREIGERAALFGDLVTEFGSDVKPHTGACRPRTGRVCESVRRDAEGEEREIVLVDRDAQERRSSRERVIAYALKLRSGAEHHVAHAAAEGISPDRTHLVGHDDGGSRTEVSGKDTVHDHEAVLVTVCVRRAAESVPAHGHDRFFGLERNVGNVGAAGKRLIRYDRDRRGHGDGGSDRCGIGRTVEHVADDDVGGNVAHEQRAFERVHADISDRRARRGDSAFERRAAERVVVYTLHAGGQHYR